MANTRVSRYPITVQLGAFYDPKGERMKDAEGS
jgi:hypothetical protein